MQIPQLLFLFTSIFAGQFGLVQSVDDHLKSALDSIYQAPPSSTGLKIKV